MVLDCKNPTLGLNLGQCFIVYIEGLFWQLTNFQRSLLHEAAGRVRLTSLEIGELPEYPFYIWQTIIYLCYEPGYI